VIEPHAIAGRVTAPHYRNFVETEFTLPLANGRPMWLHDRGQPYFGRTLTKYWTKVGWKKWADDLARSVSRPKPITVIFVGLH
jgi:hypothetical protein